MSSIFWLLLIPTVLRIALSVAYFMMKPEQKERTGEAYALANNWRECFKMFGWQAVEVLIANVIVNLMSFKLGTETAAVFNDPTVINGMKVLCALALDLIRNTIGKGVTAAQEKNYCSRPAAREQVVPV